MKSFFLFAAFCGIWMSVDGAFLECVTKIRDEPSIHTSLLGLNETTMNVLMKIIEMKGNASSSKEIETIQRDICYPAGIEDKLYSLIMQIFKTCGDHDNIFTERGIQMIKTQLKNLSSNVLVGLAEVLSSSPQYGCFKDWEIIYGIKKCYTEILITYRNSTSDHETAKREVRSKAFDCINQLKVEKCNNTIPDWMESVLDQSNVTLASGENKTVVSNSSSETSLSKSVKRYSNLWFKQSMSVLEGTCISNLSQNTDILRNTLNWEYTVTSSRKNISERISKQNSLQSLDSMVNDICLPKMHDDYLYSLMTQMFKICGSQEDIFTEEGKQLIRSLMKPSSCNFPTRMVGLSAIYDSKDACFPDLVASCMGCLFLPTPASSKPIYSFSGKDNVCKPVSKIMDCCHENVKNKTCVGAPDKSIILDIANSFSDCGFSSGGSMLHPISWFLMLIIYSVFRLY